MDKKKSVTPDYIKKLVEFKLDGLDISVKSRKRHLTCYRYVAFMLCKTYGSSKLSLESIGECFGNRNHSTVLHGIKKFKEFKDQKFFAEFLELHDSCVNSINKELNLNPEFSILKSISEVEDHYKIKHVELVEKSNSIIGSLTVKLKNLRNRPIFEEIASLSDEDLADFEVRANAFLQMKRVKNK